MNRSLRVVVTVLGLTAFACAQKPVASVQGRVLGPDGEPMVNVEVSARAGAYSDVIFAKARTDGDGMFLLARLQDDRPVQVVAQAPGHTRSIAYADLSPERPVTGVELRLYHANTLRGRVVDADGRAIAGAQVVGTKDLTWFQGQTAAIETRSDADGRFELEGVPIGDCVVRAFAPGFALREHSLVALEDTEISFPPMVREAGTTITITTEGLGVDEAAKAQVRIYATRSGSGFRLPSSVEGSQLGRDGTWRLAGLPDAEWHVELSLPGVTFDPRSLSTKVGDRSPALRFRASRDGSMVLRGRLADATGKPLANETLVCRTRRSPSMNGGRPGRTTTDADGRFVLDAPLAAGEPYSLHLVASDHVLLQPKTKGMTGSWDLRYLVRWEDVADPERELALVAVPAARVSVSLQNGDKNPVPFQWLELQRVGQAFDLHDIAYATTSRDGVASFPGVHACDFDVVVAAAGSGGAVISAPFRLAAGEHKQLDLVVKPPSRVTGRVVDAAGKAVPGVRVSLRNWNMAENAATDGSWTNVPTDRSGRFVFMGVAPGGHYVEVGMTATQDGKGQCEPFEVAPGGTADVEVRVQR